MATIDIRRAHSVGMDTAKAKAEELAKDMKDKFDLDWSWEGDRIRFKSVGGVAKGTNGVVTVAPSEVRMEMDLPLLLRALKGKISSKVEEKLNELFG
jgi:putative polyhydroxyalkanoate system protein